MRREARFYTKGHWSLYESVLGSIELLSILVVMACGEQMAEGILET